MRKIAVCGKGGSGKSAIVALLAKGARRRGYRVLVVDSDESNVGLYRMLGLSQLPNPLINLVGGKKSVEQKMGPESSEEQVEVMAQDEISVADIPAQYMVKTNGIVLVSIGKILQFLEGCACPMGVLSREFLKKLSLEGDEVAIIDMEAGLEHFGRGIETSIDSLLIVVEPSFESLRLATRINSLACEAGMDNIWAVLNKVMSQEIASKLSEDLKKQGINVIGSIGYDAEVFQSCLEGNPVYGSEAEKDIGKILDQLLSVRR